MYKTGRAAIENFSKPVELMLFPAFFPHENGFYKQRRRFSSMAYLKHRCKQAYTAFPVQCPHLLLLHAMENARASISEACGTFWVNKDNYDLTQQAFVDAGTEPTVTQVLDTLVKNRYPTPLKAVPNSSNDTN